MRVLAALFVASFGVLARPFAPARRYAAEQIPSWRLHGRKPTSARRTSSLGGASGGNPLEGILSFVKDGKARLVKSIAGEYDAAAGARYTVIELDKESDGKAVRAEMGQMLGRTSVPAIWINGEFIGGCNDGPAKYGGINNLNSQNKLDGMLKSAGAI
ncbi:hypothetical protein ACHAXA_003203 [Cyclostephanos tholiformis]|uniref:Glutaredoxin domain-containing protein n=1 Tax=Cyclostephanos tholiformis TaxID=382380 RepID=A0ABD3RYJ6_9STRA